VCVCGLRNVERTAKPSARSHPPNQAIVRVKGAFGSTANRYVTPRGLHGATLLELVSWLDLAQRGRRTDFSPPPARLPSDSKRELSPDRKLSWGHTVDFRLWIHQASSRSRWRKPPPQSTLVGTPCWKKQPQSGDLVPFTSGAGLLLYFTPSRVDASIPTDSTDGASRQTHIPMRRVRPQLTTCSHRISQAMRPRAEDPNTSLFVLQS